MVKLVILFRHSRRLPDFEPRYAHNRALLEKIPGVRRLQESNVLGGPAGKAPYCRILELFFDDFPSLDAGLLSSEGVTAGEDLMEYAGRNVDLLFVEESVAPVAQPFSPEHLQAYLNEQHIPAQIIYPGVSTPTVPAAAQALNVEADQIVKSVIFLVDDQPYLIYGCGTRRIDYRKLAGRLGVSRKRVHLADAAQVLELTGYAVGTVPPFGFKTLMPAFMDPAIQQYAVIYAGGGGINALLKITSADLLKFSQAEVVPLLQDAANRASES
jgi:uncharacterized protein (TIGR02118 family)